MNKFLKSLVFTGASVIALASAAEARRPNQALREGPTLSIGGSLTASGISASQKVRSEPNTLIQTKGNILFNLSGKADNGMTYGGLAVLELDRAKSNSDRVSELYVYLNHEKLGNIKLGDTEGVEKMMMYGGSDVLGGLGGASGDLNKIINVTRGVDFNTSIAPIDDTAPKITWVSPTVEGFQLGLAYTPDTRTYGRFKTNRTKDYTGKILSNSNYPYATNHMALGLSFNKAFNNTNLGLYATGTTAKAKAPQGTGIKLKNVNSWQIGTLVDYKNFQFGATYFDNGKSYIRSGTNWTNTKGYNGAIGYDFAANANVAVGYTHTDRKVTGGKAKADITTVTVDYILIPGLVFFGEWDNFQTKAPSATISSSTLTASDIYSYMPTTNTNNRGNVVALGTKIRF